MLDVTGTRLAAEPKVSFETRVRSVQGRPFDVPDQLPRLPVQRAMRDVQMPTRLIWSGQVRELRLSDRADRADAHRAALIGGGWQVRSPRRRGRGVGDVPRAARALQVAAERRGWSVEVVRALPEFARLSIRSDSETTVVDLCVDSPPTSAPIASFLGPAMAPADLAGRKTLALFGRAEPRDFVDIYTLAQQYGKAALVELARSTDPGFSAAVLAQMMRSLGRIRDEALRDHADGVDAVRAVFESWADELTAVS